jgi:Integrase core domain
MNRRCSTTLSKRDRPVIFMEVNLWCLIAYGYHSPSALIRELWRKFEVWTPTADGEISSLPSSLTFLHEAIERLWRSLKYEEVFTKAYGSVIEARRGIGGWLPFYNDERPHQALG